MRQELNPEAPLNGAAAPQAARQTLEIACGSLNPPPWRWLADSLGLPFAHWTFFSPPATGLLSKVRRIDLHLMNAVRLWMAQLRKRPPDLLFTHDPRVSFWCATFARRRGIRVAHVAYSFNFVKLPTGFRRRWMSRAFQDIQRFVVYSTMEQQLYSEWFGIPLEKIHLQLWGVGVPDVAHRETPTVAGRYACALGGNARDYGALIAAAALTPHVPLVLVCRPHNLEGLNVPDHVRVLTNIPFGEAMNVLYHSQFMILPLAGAQVPCGHVTLVAAMHLGKALLATQSTGIADYVFEGRNGVTCTPSDPQALAAAMGKLWGDAPRCAAMGEEGRRFAAEHCSEEAVRGHLRAIIKEFAPGARAGPHI